MASRTVTINIKTNAQLANLDKLIQKLDGVKASFDSLNHANLSHMTTSVDDFKKSVDGLYKDVKQLTNAINSLSKAGTNISANTQKAASAIQKANSQVRLMSSSFSSSSNAASRMLNNINSVTSKLRGAISGIMGVFKNLSNTVKTVFNASSRVISVFTKSAAFAFSGLQRAVNGINTVLKGFSTAVDNHMKRATNSMKNFYNAGWSLLTSGYTMRQGANRITGGLFGGLTEFMDYEKVLTRTAISAASYDSASGQMSVSPRIIEGLIFDLQRGKYGEAVKAFDAKDIAEGLYFYTSAIGKVVDENNVGQVGQVVSTIMQMASVTRTGLETATKGVINIAQEFGIDAISDKNAEAMKNIAAQVGYLANLSTMEVPDIIETFKMVGPMAHILSGDGQGSGLNEMFALTYFASELGLRGGNVGRGINQALTTLLDPSDKAIEAAAKAFGIGASETAFKAFFFNSEGELQGGIKGLFEKIAKLPDSESSALLAELFTTNATRSVIAIREAIANTDGGLQGMIDKIGSKNPMAWLAEAARATNDTIFGNFQYMKNAWFAVQTEIIRSVEGPLKNAFESFGQVLWKIGDILNSNPWIGKFIVQMSLLIGVILTVVSSLFMVSGSLLLVLKAFSMLGGLLGPFLFFLTSSVSALVILVPLVATLALGAMALYKAWNQDFGGIREKIDGLKESVMDFAAWTQFVAPTAKQAILSTMSQDVDTIIMKLRTFAAENKLLIATLRELANTIATTALKTFLGTLQEAVNIVVDIVHKINTALPTANESLTKFERSWLGFKVTIDTVAKAIGGLIGTGLASWLLFSIVPFKGIINYGLNATSVLISFGSTLAFAAIKAAIYVAQLGLSIAATVAATAITMGYTAATVALSIAKGVLKFMTMDLFMGQNLLNVATAAGIPLTSALAGAFGLLMLALGPVLATVLLITAALVALFVIGAVIAAMVTAIAAAMIIAITVTQGWRAGLEGLIAFLQGVWAVLSVGVAVIIFVAATFYNLFDAIMGLFGASNTLYTLGVIVGAALTVMLVAASGLAIVFTGALLVGIWGIVSALGSMLVAALAAALPWLALVAAILLVGEAIAELAGFDNVFELMGSAISYLTDLVHGLGRAWDWVRERTSAAADVIAMKALKDSRTQYVLDVQRNPIYDPNEMLNQAQDLGYVDTGQWGKVYRDAGQTDAELANKAAAFVTKMAEDQWNVLNGGYKTVPSNAAILGGPSTERLDPVQYALWEQIHKPAEITKAATEDATTYADGWMKKLRTELHVDEVLAKTGLSQKSIDALFKGDFKSLLSKDLFGISDAMTQDATAFSFLGENMEKYQKALNNYAAYRKASEMFKSDAKANAFYAANDQVAPTVAPDIMDYMGGTSGGTDEMDQLLKDTESFNQQITSALANGFDLKQSMAHVFDSGKGANFMGIGSVMATYGDAISNAIPQDAVWSNLYEGIMDSIVMGGGDANMYGKNIQKALRDNKGFQNWAAEMGVSVDDLIKDLPKFVHEEKYVPMAFTEIAKNVQTALKGDNQKYLNLDHLGTDLGFDGLNWTELSQYAVGKTQAGEFDWNLTNYLAEAWDKDIAWVEQYLQDHGVDPNIVNGAALPDLQMLINSNNGQVNVFTPEWYQWFQQVTANGTDKIIEITQAEFDKIPENIKLSMSASGFTFVVGDPPPELQQWAEDTYNSYIQYVQDYFNQEKGGPYGAGNTPITEEQFGFLSGGLVDNFYNSGYGQQTTPTDSMPFVPPPSDYISAAQESATAYASTFSSTLATQSGDASFNTMFDSLATSAASSFQTKLSELLPLAITNAIGGGGATVGDGTGGPMALGNPFDASFTAYGTTAVTAFDTALKPIETVSSVAGYAASAAFGTSIQGMVTATYTAATGVSTTLLNMASWAYNAAYYAGYQIGSGMAAGIDASVALVEAAAARMVAAAEAAANAKADIKSPSKLFAEVGSNMGLGVAEGMTTTISNSVSTMDTMLSATRSAEKMPRGDEREGGGTVIIQIENVTIEKDVDLLKLAADLNRLTGHKVELARRGMVPVDETKTF